MYIASKLYIDDVKRVANLPLPWDKLRGKSLLLTGASGLIGVFLVDMLMEKNVVDKLNIKIVALGRDEEKAKERFVDYWENENFSFVSMDINKPIDINVKVDYIIHAASNTNPKLYASDPVGSLITNVMGTYNLLEYAKGTEIKRFVFLSSVEIYGQALKTEDVFDEEYCGYIDCNQFRAAYPEGKRAGEALCNAYIKKYNIDVVIPRLSRVYGPTVQLNDNKAMSQFIMNGVRGEDIVLKSNGEQRYSYCYVADAVSGILYTMFLGKRGEAYNVADMDGAITLREITENIADYVGRKVVVDLPDEQEATGFSRVSVGVMETKKLQGLGWRAFDGVKSGTRKTIKALRRYVETVYMKIDIDSLVQSADKSNYLYLSKNFDNEPFDVLDVLSKNGESASQEELCTIKNNIPLYYAEFKKMIEIFEQSLSKKQFSELIKKLEIKETFSLYSYLSKMTECTVLYYLLQKNVSDFKYEPKYNGEKNPECSFIYEGRTVNIEVKCPNYENRIQEESALGLKYMFGKRVQHYKDINDKIKNTIPIATEISRVENKLKDFCISAHGKFPKSDDTNFNILVICLDIMRDMDEWYNYLFDDSGGIFSNNPFFEDDVSNIDAIMLSTVCVGHIRWIKFPVKAWQFDEALNLLFISPHKDDCKKKYYAKYMIPYLCPATIRFYKFIDEMKLQEQKDAEILGRGDYNAKHVPLKNSLISSFAKWLRR